MERPFYAALEEAEVDQCANFHIAVVWRRTEPNMAICGKLFYFLKDSPIYCRFNPK